MGQDLPIDLSGARPAGGAEVAGARDAPLRERLAYWAEAGRRVDWIDPYTQVATERFEPADPVVRWFADGTLNVAYNCLDRHAEADPDRPALVWDAIDPADGRTFTRAGLLAAVCRFANVLKAYGVTRGEAVGLFLPTVPEAVIAMLAAARIGAIHTNVFTGFSGKALAARLRDCGARVLVTADAAPVRGGVDPLKAKVDVAAGLAPSLEKVIVVRRTGRHVTMHPRRDVWLHDVADEVSDRCPPEEMGAEDPLFIAYTMGVSGRPRGVVHASGGYLVHVAETLERVLGGREGTTVFATPDISHVAAHSYAVYGPLANGATTLLSESLSALPDAAAHLALLARHRVGVYYTTPTLARDLAASATAGRLPGPPDPPPVVGTFGEALSPDVETFLRAAIAGPHGPVIDTWWQTESGGILLASGAAGAPAAPDFRAGRPPEADAADNHRHEREGEWAVSRPVDGVEAAVLDRDGRTVTGEGEGELVLTASWPGQARTIHGDHLRYAHGYFSRFRGVFRTGDSAVRFADGGIHVLGRLDEILHLAGHRVPADEVERALADHRNVVEAAVVDLPRAARLQGLCAFLVLGGEVADQAALEADLSAIVRRRIGDFAVPALYHPVRALPRARSGRIVRRILRRAVAGTYADTDDALTLSDPGVVDDILTVQRHVLPN